MNWWNLCLLSLLVAGHTQLWVAFINRLHALPLPKPFLQKVRHVHDLAILAFPPVLFWYVGWRGPQLLSYGRWSDLSPTWAVWLAMCALGFVGLVWSIVRYHTKSSPPALVNTTSEMIDIAQELGGAPIGEGPYRWMTGLPGNEQFTVELNEKRLVLPHLPEEWSGLRILQLSDWHLTPTLRREFFDVVTEHALTRTADLVVFTGDLVDDLDCLDWLPDTIGRIDARLGRYFILGNHDWALGSEDIRRTLSDAGWQSIGSRTFTIEFKGRRLILGGDETPWIGRTPDFSKSSPDEFKLLLSHTPDHFPRARRAGVDLVLSGHNHGGQVVLPVLGPVYAPSRFGVRYADGLFAAHPTVMHVSRGLSGQHPYRWRCRPEVTWLILEREPG
ncbi:MAG: metallophosphoesterase [Planctomycetaceae bacterium]|nr:metallophosphoesterase [Planctomycetaceae bacterium]